jgi:cysteine desulfurase
MKKIYLDYSATTPVDKEVMQVMSPYFLNKFGNPSSMHSFGQDAMAGVDKAREQAAHFLNCEPDEIIFTSGATESDNLAIKGVIKALLCQGYGGRGNKKLHIITTSIEHSAVLEPCRELEKPSFAEAMEGKGGVEVTYLPVKSNGVVDIEKFKKAIKDNTVLVSIMHVNSEVGSIQPIREIGKIIRKINDKKLREWRKFPLIKSKRDPSATLRVGRPRPIYFHTDATQAINFLNCDVSWNYVDMLSMSGHKIYGPKGVGVLYIKSGVPIKPLQLGGHQENNLRSGTYNVPGIVGMGKALELLDKKTVEKNNLKIAKLRDMLVAGIKKDMPDVVFNTDKNNSTPSHANFSFLGVEGESILISLDLEGIAVSTGSACASGKLEPSHVLLAMGIKQEVAHNSIRFTLGKYTTEAEIKKTVKILPPIIKRLRKMSPIDTK